SIHSFADLRGRRIAVGAHGSGMVQHAQGIFAALGLSFSDFAPVYLDFAAGAEALAAAEIDAQFQCPIPNAVMTALAERASVRVLPYQRPELAAVLQAVPYYRGTVRRKSAFRGLARDLPQVAVINVLVTHMRVPDAIVREAAATIIANSRELGDRNPLF